MLRSCSNFCLRFACFLRKGSTLYFEKSGIVVVIDDEILGEGGFSTVYKASSKKDNSSKYAVKRVLVQTDDIHKAVLAEIKSLSTFHHANIIKMIDSLENCDRSNNRVVFLLFPLMRRGTLRHVLNERVDDQQRKNLDLAKIVGDFKAICLAFNYMHTFAPVRYIHQDIKPENILISDDGTPLLTDFGSVRVAEIFIDSRNKALIIAEEAAQFCSLPYRAPELFDPPTNTTLDSRTDVWGMGCLLYAWWFHYSPFECEFSSGNMPRVVECSYTRVLSKIPSPPTPSENDKIIIELVEWILVHDMHKRPFSSDVIARMSSILTPSMA